MLTAQLSFFFYLYLAFLAIFIIFFLVDLFHLINTGTITFVSALFSLAMVVFSLFILSLTWDFAQTVDWSVSVVIWDTSWITHLF